MPCYTVHRYMLSGYAVHSRGRPKKNLATFAHLTGADTMNSRCLCKKLRSNCKIPSTETAFYSFLGNRLCGAAECIDACFSEWLCGAT